MEIIVIGFLLALSKVILLFRIFPAAAVVRNAKWIDLTLTLVLPALAVTTGSFSGMLLMLMSGLFVTLMLLVAKLFVRV